MNDVEGLIREHQKLVPWCLSRVRHRPQMADEAESAANSALWRAAVNFKAELGYQFSTYATRAITNAIRNAARQHAHDRRKRRECGLESASGSALMLSPWRTPDEQVIGADQAEVILDRLPGGWATVVRLLAEGVPPEGGGGTDGRAQLQDHQDPPAGSRRPRKT